MMLCFRVVPRTIAVVYDNQIVRAGHEAAVSDVVHMGGKVVATVALGNESTQLNVLNGHLLAPYAAGQDTLQLIVAGVVSQSGNLPHLLLVEIVVQSLQHSVESHFRSIRYKGKDGVVYILVDGFQDVGHQFLTQQFTFLVDVHVTAAAEIDTLEGASFTSRGLLICTVRSLPALLISKACPGCSSLMRSAETLSAVWMTGRSLASTAISSS